MEDKTTEIRKGAIGAAEVEFTVIATFNGAHVCGAEGHFVSPSNAYNQYVGASQALNDKNTDITYEILVAPNRFSFSTYEDIDKLFE